MKKKIIYFLFLCICSVQVVSAASVSVTSSSNVIATGGRVTFYIKINNAASWVLEGSGIGSTTGCSLGDERVGDTGTGKNGNKTLSVTCAASDVGQIAFSVTGSVWDENFNETPINVSKGVTVTKPREKDTNNYLQSIGVTGYTLTPEFNQDTMEYSVEVPNTVDKVTLEAVAASGYATVSGTGEVEVNEGANTFEIKVLSETGSERIYKITVNVIDENPIELQINNASYTVVKNAKNVEVPSTFEATTVTIDEMEIPAFYSEVTDFTLVAVKNQTGDVSFAIYNEEKNTYTLYNENVSDQLYLYILSATEEKEGFVKTTLTINDNTYDVLKSENGNTYLVYAMDIYSGEKHYYLYDQKNNSYILYDEDLFNSFTMEITRYKQVVLAFGGAIIVLLLCIMFLLFKKPKNTKKKAYKEALLKMKEEEKKRKDDDAFKKHTKEDAVEKMNDATKIIEDFESNMETEKKQEKSTANKRKKEKK